MKAKTMDVFLSAVVKAFSRMFGGFFIQVSKDCPDAWDVFVGNKKPKQDVPDFNIYKVIEKEEYPSILKRKNIVEVTKYYFDYSVVVHSFCRDEPDDVDVVESPTFGSLGECLTELGKELIRREVENASECAYEADMEELESSLAESIKGGW